jgi:hypothetical protein
MWNLSGDDIQRAKEELKGRAAAIKARYDKEMKQLEADIAAIETFERAAVDFVSNFKGQDEASAVVADPAPAVEPVAGDTAGEQSSPTDEATQVAQNIAAEAAPATEAPASGKGSSRWRMRLGATEGSR